MIDITVVLWMFIAMFGTIGFVRGWAREVLVTASVVIAFFVIVIIESYVPFVLKIFESNQVPDSEFISMYQFWFELVILVAMIFLGYETPNIPQLAGNRFKRDNFRDSVLGLLSGAFNGYLVMGSIWYLLAQAGYPGDFVQSTFGTSATWWLTKLPPIWLMQIPHIFFFIAVIIVFIIAVFI